MRFWIMKDSVNNRYIWDDKSKSMYKVNGNEATKIKAPSNLAKFTPAIWLVQKTNKKPDIIKDIP